VKGVFRNTKEFIFFKKEKRDMKKVFPVLSGKGRASGEWRSNLENAQKYRRMITLTRKKREVNNEIKYTLLT
jgi:hypothetical protein